MKIRETLKFLKNNPWTFYYSDGKPKDMNYGSDFDTIMVIGNDSNEVKDDYYKRHEVIDEIGSNIIIQEVPSGWIGIDEYNYDHLDFILDQVLKNYPNRYFIPRVHMEPPNSWLKANPREVSIYYGGPNTEKEIIEAFDNGLFDHLGYDMDPKTMIARQSLSSIPWLKESLNALRKFIEHIENGPYGKQIIAYMPMMGNCGENMWWGDWVSQGNICKGDFGLSHRERFYQFCLDKYGNLENLRKAWKDDNLTYDTFRVPYPNERWSFYSENVHHPYYFYESINNKLDIKTVKEVMLVDDQRQVDCNEFHSKVVFDVLETWGKLIKEMTGKAVGAFYGYLQDPTVGYAGHLAIDRALTTPYIDFYSSPKAYHYCLGGDPGASQAPGQSFARKKMWIEENDMRSYHGGTCYCPKTLEDSVYCYWREIYRALTLNQGFWWMNIMGLSDDWYTDPVLVPMFKDQAKFYKKWAPIKRNSVAEVLFIEDTESCGHTTYLNGQQFGLRYKLERELKLCGAPVDHYLIDDLLEMDLSQYKVICFCHAFVLDYDKWLRIKAKLRKDVYIIWNYCAGLLNPTYDLEKQKLITGFNTIDCKGRMEHKDRYHHVYWHCDTIIPYDYPLLELVGEDYELLQETPDHHTITALKKMDTYTSVFSCDITLRTPILRSILERANVNFYAPKDMTVLADDKLIGFFARFDNCFNYNFNGNYRNVITGEIVNGDKQLKIKAKNFAIFEKVD